MVVQIKTWYVEYNTNKWLIGKIAAQIVSYEFNTIMIDNRVIISWLEASFAWEGKSWRWEGKRM